MNWLFVAVIIILLFFIIRGYRRGLLRVLFSLVSVIVLILLVGFVTPYVSQFLTNNTKIETTISDRVTTKIQDSAEASVDSAAESQEESLEAAGIQLPTVLQNLLNKSVQGTQNALSESGLYQQAGNSVANIIIKILTFLIALIIASIIVWLIGRATNVVNKIPLIGGINRTLGLFAGAVQGFIIVWLIFMFISVISGTALGRQLIESINENAFLGVLYNNNLVLVFVSNFL